MNELDFDYTLFFSRENKETTPYELQICTASFEGSYAAGSYAIITTPENNTGILELQLTLLSGNDSIIIHDFSLDILPSEAQNPTWEIHVEYLDESGSLLRRKKKNTEQAKIESKPRPFKVETI